MLRTKFFAFLALVLVLAACSGTPTPTASPTRPVLTAAAQPIGLEPADLTATAVPRGTKAPSDTPAPPRPVSPTTAPVCRAATGANLRAGPGTDFARVGGVAGGQALLVVAKNQDGGWLQVDNGGWIKGELTENCPDVPVAAVIPTPAPVPTATPQPPSAAAAIGQELVSLTSPIAPGLRQAQPTI